MRRRSFLQALAAIPLASPAHSYTPGKEGASRRAWLDRAFAEELAHDPTRAARLGYPDANGRPHTAWTLKTEDWYAAVEARARTWRREIAAHSSTVPGERDDLELFAFDNDLRLASVRWRRHAVPFFPELPPYVAATAHLRSHQPLGTLEDAKAYVQRAEAIAELVDCEMMRLEATVPAQTVPARFNFPDLRRSSSEAIAALGAPESHPIVTHFREALASREWQDAERSALVERLEQALEGPVRAAVVRYAEAVERVGKKASADHGAWALPEGKAYYRAQILEHCTLDLDPAELHAWGLDETRRLHDELHAIARRVGFEGTTRAFLRHLSTDERFFFSGDAAGRARHLAAARGYIEGAKSALNRFTTHPLTVNVVVEEVDPLTAASAGRAGYTEPPADGSGPGVFHLNTWAAEGAPSYQLEAVCYHEAIPGHHLQAVVALQRRDLPLFRRHLYLNSFAEGWGLYAERFPRELGFYDDAYQDAGRVALELFRAVRVVLDTGIHHGRWTFDQALEYMNTQSGNAPSDNLFEVKRYFNWPGQALGYKVGMRHLLRLRREAEKRLGGDFGLPWFHDAVLENGAVTLPMLSQNVADALARRTDRR